MCVCVCYERNEGLLTAVRAHTAMRRALMCIICPNIMLYVDIGAPSSSPSMISSSRSTSKYNERSCRILVRQGDASHPCIPFWPISVIGIGLSPSHKLHRLCAVSCLLQLCSTSFPTARAGARTYMVPVHYLLHFFRKFSLVYTCGV